MPKTVTRTVQHDLAAPAVRAERLTVRYDGRPALQEVTFHLPAGQRLAVVGPNGAGKSTLFQAVAGVLQPTSGEVRVYGRRPGGHVCIAYVPQRSQVDWSFPATVAEVVMMGRVRQIGFLRWPGRDDWRYVHRALERVGMAGMADRQIGELSGGQQQRVFLARALAQHAELVLLDEPLTGLDVPSQETIFRLLDEMADEGVTVLIATHDLNLAAERFDQVMLLNRRLVALGPPREVFTRPLLQQAYGSHMHVLQVEGQGELILTDTCCEGEET